MGYSWATLGATRKNESAKTEISKRKSVAHRPSKQKLEGKNFSFQASVSRILVAHDLSEDKKSSNLSLIKSKQDQEFTCGSKASELAEEPWKELVGLPGRKTKAGEP
ncbi:hypothetical protein QP568_10015 [Propionimicrobium lymphophilum]|uniref:hypothetical protein n=1 Tax=Propionimicrobium lymphophilum TaxID=33012 RepID=UPI00254FA62A|nr:hypothetical protein [Propionimicrobium lymphophilum]MDK7710837.1 hypothetical protein [Propionimicrobium lymphophilum]MDK7734618.1 hypothetical protein [Propionimicrobium lymphophilum]